MVSAYFYRINVSSNNIAIAIPETINGIADSMHSFSFDLSDNIEKANVATNNTELIIHPICRNIIETTKNAKNKYDISVYVGNSFSFWNLFVGQPQLGQVFALSLTSLPHSGHFINAIATPPLHDFCLLYHAMREMSLFRK